MARAVHCDICGKLFSSSYVKAHKRLAHKTADSVLSESEAIQKILRLFKELSPADKKKVLRDLREQELSLNSRSGAV